MSHLTYVELAVRDFLEAEEAGITYVSPANLLREFLKMFLQPTVFAGVHVPESSSIFDVFRSGHRAELGCRKIKSVEEASAECSKLERLTFRGWGAVYVLSQPAPDLQQWFERASVAASSGILGDGKRGDVLSVAPRDSGLAACLTGLELHAARSACVFGHDADLVYVLESDAAAE